MRNRKLVRPAWAGFGEDLHQIVGPHPQQRAGLAPDRGVDHLALLPVDEREGVAGVGVDQLSDGDPGRAVMHAVKQIALTGMEPELAGPVLVPRDHAPGVLDPFAVAGDLEPSLAREVALRSPTERGSMPISRRRRRGGRVRRSRPDPERVLQPGHHRDQALGVADAERDRRCAEGLERQVVAEATRVQAVVHALEDDLARAAAHRPQRLGAHLAVVRDVAARQARCGSAARSYHRSLGS